MSRRGPKRGNRKRGRTGRSESAQHQSIPSEYSGNLGWRPDMWLSSLFESRTNNNPSSSAGGSSEVTVGMEDSKLLSLGVRRRGRRKRPAAGTVAIFSVLCAALLWVGAVSFSRSQLPTGTLSNSTRRTSEVCFERPARLPI